MIDIVIVAHQIGVRLIVDGEIYHRPNGVAVAAVIMIDAIVGLPVEVEAAVAATGCRTIDVMTIVIVTNAIDMIEIIDETIDEVSAAAAETIGIFAMATATDASKAIIDVSAGCQKKIKMINQMVAATVAIETAVTI